MSSSWEQVTPDVARMRAFGLWRTNALAFRPPSVMSTVEPTGHSPSLKVWWIGVPEVTPFRFVGVDS